MIIIPRWRGRVYNQGKLSKGVDMSWWGPDFPSAEMIERGWTYYAPGNCKLPQRYDVET